MADNVPVTSGTGTNIATDDVGGVHFQKVKLVDGTADSSAAIPGDATNGLYVQMRQAQRLAVYRAATDSNVAAPASANGFFVLYGSASKTIRVRKVRVFGPTLTAVAYMDIELSKHSAAPSGGTATALTKVPADSNDAAATANLCQVYTVAPTPGAAVGNLGSRRLLGQATTAAAGGQPMDAAWDFTSNGDDRGNVVLRGTGQGIMLSFGAAPATAVTLSVEVEWTEE